MARARTLQISLGERSYPIRLGEGTLDAVANWQPITFPLAGRDAIARGIPSGPEVGKLLVAVEDWWLRQNRRPDRVACLSELERQIEASGEAE